MKRSYFFTLHKILSMFLLSVIAFSPSFNSLAKIRFQANIADSIEHFRAIPAYLIGEQPQLYSRYFVQDKEGFLWASGEKGLLKYDGYSMAPSNYQMVNSSNYVGSPYVFVDSKKRLVAGASTLSIYSYASEQFETIDIAENAWITSIVEDDKGYLWIAVRDFGFLQFDLDNKKVLRSYTIDDTESVPSYIASMQYDDITKVLWMTSTDGVHRFNTDTEALQKVDTPLDDYFGTFILRDITFDQQHKTLWLASNRGLLALNTESLISKLYVANQEVGSLPVSDTTTTLLDSAGNLWVGLEKEGLCTYRYSSDDFICLRSAFDEENKLPFATIEEIYEDKSGTLWLAMNQFGIYQITPDLEKFSRVKDRIKSDYDSYFANSMGAVLRDNGELWIATDGGGINIFNTITGAFENIKQDVTNQNSLSSNSVISITKDELGNIWTGSWDGGISRINPDTRQFSHYSFDVNSSNENNLMGNNVFAVETDKNGGIWAGIWGEGLQYINFVENEVVGYSYTNEKSDITVASRFISDLTIFQGKVYFVGEMGLEEFDPVTKKSTTLLSTIQYGYNHVHIESLDEIWIATFDGLLLYNANSQEVQSFNVIDGLPHKEVMYITKHEDGEVWIATGKGISIFDPISQTFRNLSQKDGLIDDSLSSHGEFIEVENDFYIMGKYGVNIINPKEIPIHDFLPNTRITQVSLVDTLQLDMQQKNTPIRLALDTSTTLPFESNSLTFSFSALSFVSPTFNRYKYRLKGWQTEYVYANTTNRTSTYTNLPEGDYTFEVFAANSNGLWDEQGDQFSFTILPPWWRTWWAISLFVCLLIASIFLIIQWRLALINRRKKHLEFKVQEKTTQLQTYAIELKRSSESLSELNAELESRVEARTIELQSEINEKNEAQSKLFFMAFHDSLTSMHNREWLIQRIEELIEKAQEDDSFTFTVFFLDGDRFKHINDTHGHIYGDKVLISAAKRLNALMGENQFAGRLGGDEFTVIAESHSKEEAEALAQKILDGFKAPFYIDKNTVHFNVSIGVLMCDAQHKTVPDVLRFADIAMYNAKESGKAVYRFFDEHMHKKSIEEAELESDLLNALSNNEFYLVYQPIVQLEDGLIVGFEALLRWEHPERGLISPLSFIPIAEETGLIWDIGKWVLKEACRQTKQWHDTIEINPTAYRPSISINLSTNQIQNDAFLDMLDSIITQTEVDPRYVKLELTETILIENSSKMTTIFSSLRERKIDLAIDDFGTGYSSLSYLNEIPVQFLKIDKCFVEAIDANTNENPNNDALEILKATISLGKSLRKHVTAEGIETETQLSALIEYGCDFIQGYFVAKPLSQDDATRALFDDSVIEKGGVNIDKSRYAAAYKIRARGK